MVGSTQKENSPLMKVLLWTLKVMHLLMFSATELPSLYLQLRKKLMTEKLKIYIAKMLIGLEELQ